MPTLTIDGQEVTVDAGTTVIQAAEQIGINIPRYCYHPGLSLAGRCRMCLVEIETFPNLQIACYTRAQDEMVVSTTSERVLSARQSMLEFLLSNHPLDCPVCDQSGECDLQNFYMDHGQYQSRFLENKVKKKKAFPIGPHVILDQERCILCTRCVRFTEEVSKSNELGVFNRGSRSVIDLYPTKSLDNPYSGNVIDICPVGALTEREFRFKCRVWYLASQESICTGCSRGCNISLDYNGSRRAYKAGGRRVMRIKPRYNPDINKWWICDEGRFGYGFIDTDRIETPMQRTTSDLEPSDWDPALARVAETVKAAYSEKGANGVGVIVSPQLSNEELLACRELFVEKMKLTNVAALNPWEEPGEADDFLRNADRNPNTKGVEDLGYSGDAKAVLEKAAEGEIEVLIIFRHNLADGEAGKLLEKAKFVVYVGTNWNATAERAHVVLPGATHAEKDGTFTNFEGRVQRFKQALLPIGDSRNDSQIISEMAAKLGYSLPASADEIFEAWKGISLDELSGSGSSVDPDTAVQA
ncbi:MAG: molybdopterin-dependent oxidoreductase [Acidobacteriota bacterium]|nr:MAG: molybdopterin-dependent oxidoreductase [Acidobacteriota bacterium]